MNYLVLLITKSLKNIVYATNNILGETKHHIYLFEEHFDL